jgi:hypothetical protein
MSCNVGLLIAEGLREPMTRITMPAPKNAFRDLFVGTIFQSNTTFDLAMALQCFMYGFVSSNAQLFGIWFGPSSRGTVFDHSGCLSQPWG